MDKALSGLCWVLHCWVFFFFLKILVKDLQDAVFRDGYIVVQYVGGLAVAKESYGADT